MYRISLLLAVFLSSCCCPHYYEPCENPSPPEPIEVPDKIRVALVLGSGGVKGMVHVGVLEELENAGIKIDLIVGCSAGGLVGALYCDNPCAQNLKDVVAKMRTSNVLDISLWTCRYGLSQGRYLEKLMADNLSTRCFEDLQIPLVVVATDLFSGELVPFGTGDLLPAVQASCSIPFVFAPVNYRDRILVDGGVINPVPVCVAKDLGAEIIIAVDLCELLPQTFPRNLFGVARRSAEIAFMWQNHSSTKQSTIVIRPKLYNVGMFDDELKEMLYEAGRQACVEALPYIKEAISHNYCPEGVMIKRRVALPCYTP